MHRRIFRASLFFLVALGLIFSPGFSLLSPVPAHAQTTGSTFSFTRDLTVGDTGADVSALQQFLITGNFLHVPAPTGYFGDLTAAAVAAWQGTVGLPSTGYFGPLSRAKIASSGGSGTTGSTSGDIFTRDLTVGDTGADVSALQQFLITGNFLHVPAPTGYFGDLTAAAVAAWQGTVGLPSTGYFGPLSRAKIALLLAGSVGSGGTGTRTTSTATTTTTSTSGGTGGGSGSTTTGGGGGSSGGGGGGSGGGGGGGGGSSGGGDTTPPTINLISPAQSSTLSGTVVVSANATDNVGVASVQFYLDGLPLGVPVASAPYQVFWNSFLSGNGIHKLGAIAYDAAGNAASAPIVTVTVLNAPTITLTAPPANSTLSGTVTISAGASSTAGNPGVQFIVDGLPLGPVVAAPPYQVFWNTVAGSNGTDTIRAEAVDLYGNQTITPSITVTVNNSVSVNPPSVPQNLVVTGTTTSTVSLTWSASTDSGGTLAGYKIYRGGVQVGTSTATSFTNTGLAASTTYTYTVAAYDTLGNISAQSARVSATTQNLPDTTPPTIAITTPVNNAIVSGDVAISGTASDNVAVASVAISINGGSYTNAAGTAAWNYSWNTLSLANGNYSITARATDTSGNTSVSSITVMVKNVATPPSIPQNLVVTGTTTSTVSLSWSASSAGTYPVAGYDVYRNGSLVGTTTATSFTNTGLTASTTYIYTVAAYDNAGNASGQSASVNATTQKAADITPPTISITSPANGANVSGSVSITGIANDNVAVASVAVSIDGGNYVSAAGTTAWNYSWSTTGVANGNHTITARATDTSGNTASASVNVSVNNTVTPPSVPQNLKVTGTTTSTVLLAWSASTAGSYPIAGYDLYRNGALAASTTATSFTNTGLAASTTYTYTVAAYDTMGNSSAQSASVNATTQKAQDLTPPTITITSPANGATVSGSITIKGTAADNVSVSAAAVSIDGGAYVNAAGTSTWSYSWNTAGVANGNHTITARATDTSGNTAGTAVSVIVSNVVTITPPSVPQNLAVTGTTTSTVSLSWSPSTAGTYPVAGYDLYRGGTQVGTSAGTSFTDSGLSASTTYSYTVAAYDTMGNISSLSASVNATTQKAQDITPPTISITSPTNGATVSGTVSVSGVAADNVGLASVAISIDGASYITLSGTTAWNYSWSTTGVTNGNHTVTVKAADTSGNIATASVTVIVNNVAVPPSVPQNLVVTGTTTSTVSLSWSPSAAGTYPVSGYDIYRGGTQVGTSAGTSFTNTGLAASTTYIYTVAAYDTMGNASAQSASVNATTQKATDITPPTISISAPANGATITGTVNVSGISSDNRSVASVAVSIDGGAYTNAVGTTTWSYAWNTMAVTNGNHTVTARATDTSGNTATASISIIVSNVVATNQVIVNAVFPPTANSTDGQNFLKYVMTNPLIHGTNPGIYWNAIDTGPANGTSQYQWKSTDTGLAPYLNSAIANNKILNIIVLPFGYSSTEKPPAYITSDTNIDEITPAQCKEADSFDMPVVWEPDYVNAYKAFINQVLLHFSAAPYSGHIGYIRFGLSRAGEVDPLCDTNEVTLYNQQNGTNLTAQQWMQTYWAQTYDLSMLNYEETTERTLGINIPIMAPTTQAGNPDITPYEAANGIANGFGFGNQGLEASDVTGAPKNCSGDWCALFNQYVSQAPLLELQTLYYTDPSGKLKDGSMQAATGPLPPLITVGLQNNASDFELYYQDVMLALMPTQYCIANQSSTGNQCNTDSDGKGSTIGADYLAALKAAVGQ